MEHRRGWNGAVREFFPADILVFLLPFPKTLRRKADGIEVGTIKRYQDRRPDLPNSWSHSPTAEAKHLKCFESGFESQWDYQTEAWKTKDG